MKPSKELQRFLHVTYYESMSRLKQEVSKKYLGVLWWILDPILYMGVFYLLFATGLRGGAKGPEFIWFLFCGLVPWKWFASCLDNCARSIEANAGLISQVYFPKIILPTTMFVAQTYKFVIVATLLLLAMLAFGQLELAALHWILLLILLQGALNLSLGALMAALVPFVPDLRDVITYCTIFLFFLSGIFFDPGQLSPEAAEWLKYNPMMNIICYWRWALTGLPVPEFISLKIVVVETLVLTLCASVVYRRYDRLFARLVI